MALSNIEEKLERTIFEALRLTSVAEGYTPNITAYDLENPNPTIAKAAQVAYDAALKTIQNSKGFAIDIFNYGPSQARGLKKVPRIAIQTEAFYPGNTGLDTAPTYKFNNVTQKYEKKTSISLVSDFFFNIHLVANTVTQHRVLHGIMVATLPRMGYIKWYDENGLRLSHNLFVKYLSPMEADFLSEGIIEKIYRYHIPDAHEIDDITIETGISPIKEITTDIKGSDFEEQLIVKK